MKKYVKEFLPYFIIIVAVILLRTFIITPVRVDGLSMYPTLDNGDILLLKKYDHQYERFDVVVLKYQGSKLVKRIIGLPGDHIAYQDSILYVNDKKVDEPFLPENLTFEDFDTILLGNTIIPDDYYLVLGDNRNDSTDSRILGLISKKQILGTVTTRLFPFQKMGRF